MLIPIKDKLIVLALDDPDTWGSAGIIARPHNTKDRSDQGIVKAVGPDVKHVRIGDYVTFSPYSGMVINDADEGAKHILLTEDGVLTLVTPPTTLVPGLFYKSQFLNTAIDENASSKEEFIPVTAEAALQMIRLAYHSMPRVIQFTNKFDDRLKLAEGV